MVLGVAFGLGASGCDVEPSDFASFLSDDFGRASDSVTALDESGVEAIVNDLMAKFRAYQTLREVVPFEALNNAACVSELDSSTTRLSMVVEGACAFGAPADGQVVALQEVLASTPVGVVRTTLDYEGVLAAGVHVDGREVITDTDGADGASVRELALEQDGVTFAYEFRLGTLEDDVPVFDYVIASRDGDVLARLTNPGSVGGFATLILSGLDGALVCEIRNTDPTRPARGTCENGVVFGLPD